MEEGQKTPERLETDQLSQKDLRERAECKTGSGRVSWYKYAVKSTSNDGRRKSYRPDQRDEEDAWNQQRYSN